jgi:Tol biopolymer transport system component
MRLRAGVGHRILGHGIRVYQAAPAILAAALLACSPDAPPRLEGSASDGLVFVRIVEGSNELVWLRLLDGAERQLTATPDREEIWPYWSSQAQRLVFQVAHQRGESNLVVWQPEGGEERLGETPARQERWPAWSPAGPRLVYAFLGGHPPAGLAIADFESGEHRVVARSGPRDVFLRPSWSPDGRLLVAQRHPPRGPGSDLWLISPGTPPRRLTDDPASYDMKAWFTRDGRRILFSRRSADGGPHDVMLIDVDRGDPRPIIRSEASDDHSARPSPTRDEFAFVSDRSGRPQIHRARIDGSGVRRISFVPGSAYTPRWSPDGEKLVVIATEPGRGEPRLRDREGLATTRIMVLDRSGETLVDVSGFMGAWMPAWR